MAVPYTIQIQGLGTSSAPLNYTVGGTALYGLVAVTATFDGTGAVSSFLPVLEVLSSAGTVMAHFQGTAIAAGASGDVTYAPFLGSAAGGGGGGGTPPAFVSRTHNDSLGQTFTINKPAGVQIGDVILANLEHFGNAANITGFAGFTSLQKNDQIINAAPNGGTQYVLSRIVDGTEGSSFTFTWDTINYNTGILAAYTTTGGVDTSVKSTPAQSTTPQAPSIVVSRNKSAVVICVADGDGASTAHLIGAASSPYSFTARDEWWNQTSAHVVEVQDATNVLQGPTGAITVPFTRLPTVLGTIGMVVVSLLPG